MIFLRKTVHHGPKALEIESDVDDILPLEPRDRPRPTRRDDLKADSTIGIVIITRKMEAILGSFNRQLHLDETKTMKTTALTGFF